MVERRPRASAADGGAEPPRRDAGLVVVVPNWNGLEVLPAAVASLEAQSEPVTVVVIDNGSHDGSVQWLAAEHPDVVRIELPVNRGFAGGVNAGIAYALEHGAEAVATFNNDAVADPDWLRNLVAVLREDPSVGLVTSKITRMDGTHLDTTGEFYSTSGQPFPRGRNQRDEGQFDRAEPVFAGSGCATLYRTDTLRQIGLFDERFFAYYEDMDLSFRAQLAGWQVVYQPTARVLHHVSATSGRLGSFTRYHANKNFLLLYLKNMPGRLFWRHLPQFGLEALRQAVWGLLCAGDTAYARALLRVLRDAPAIAGDRRRVQAQRRVTTAYVDGWLLRGLPPAFPALDGADGGA